MTRGGCLERMTTMGKKSSMTKHLIVGILASYFTGPRLFSWYINTCIFFPRSLSPSCCYKSILSVDAFIHVKADTESEVAKAAIKLRNT